MPWAKAVALRRTTFDTLPGWAHADVDRIWPVWQAVARAVLADTTPLRAAQPVDPAVRGLLSEVAGASVADVRGLVETLCEPCEIEVPGFLTGYYEPVVAGSLEQTAEFTAPVLPGPADLVTLAPGERAPGLPDHLAAGRRRADASLEPYPDRASIEDWAAGPDARPLVWLRDWTEVFLIHVQGSARVRLPDGSERRLVYAGRNGHPYTSIGRILVEAGEIAPADMSLDRLKGWLRAHGQAVGEAGRSLLQRNRSYIFFDMVPADDGGPIGGAGRALTAGVSIAVDRTIWPYGLPLFISTADAVPGFGPAPLARLFIAEDTGSAIVGPARVDLFLGSGDAAGEAAGRVRHPARVTVLLPKAS